MIYKDSRFNYRKKFVPNIRYKRSSKVAAAKQQTSLYSKNWDAIRKRIYARDGYRCVVCGKKCKLHAHHIVPVKISKDNSGSNLVSLCEKHHRQFEALGFKILKNGGGRVDIKRAELRIIAEARTKRRKDVEQKSDDRRNPDKSSCKDNKYDKRNR